MPVSPQDFELYSRMTGAPMPTDAMSRMQMAPDVYNFTKNFARKPNILEKTGNLVKNIGLGHDKATHTNNYFKYLISTPNKKLSIFQSNQLGYIEPVVNYSVDEKFHKKIILKNSLYNRFVYRLLKLFRRI